MAIYGVGRIVIDLLRGDQRIPAGFLSAHQLAAATVGALALGLLAFRTRDTRAKTVTVTLDVR